LDAPDPPESFELGEEKAVAAADVEDIQVIPPREQAPEQVHEDGLAAPPPPVLVVKLAILGRIGRLHLTLSILVSIPDRVPNRHCSLPRGESRAVCHPHRSIRRRSRARGRRLGLATPRSCGSRTHPRPAGIMVTRHI